MSSANEQLAKLLRTPSEVIFNLEKKMNQIANQEGIIEKIVQENQERIKDRLKKLNLKEETGAQEVYLALLKKTKETSQAFFDYFGEYQELVKKVKDLVGSAEGFYLKEEKAKELFRKSPPPRIMDSLGYDDIEQMLAQEDIFELFCALRFVEDSDWMNKVFFRPFQDLAKDDFEKREIKLMVLPEKWAGIGQKFLGEKLHHMSHLKEMGVVFVVPVKETGPGEMLYLFFMTLHYFFEVDWHSRLFEIYSKKENFAQKMINALKVETSSMPLPNDEKMSWRIAPAYLAKKDPDDQRLFEPHISPEAWHYTRVSKMVEKLSSQNHQLGLNFWNGLDIVIGLFSNNLVSFSLYDNGISFLGEKNFESRYLYHQQEALWNEIFIQYLGEGKLDKLMMENLDKGFVIL